MNLGQRHWTTRLISQVLCCTIFLQTGTLAAGYLPAPPDHREWMTDERLAALAKAGLPPEAAEPAAADLEPEPEPEPVRIAALQEKPAPPKGLPPSSILTDAADEAAIPAARPKPVQEEREEPPAPVEIRPEDLPPFPPGMDGATLQRFESSQLQAITALSLVPSWNLASVQNEPVDKSPASVFSSIAGKFTRVFAYNACTPADPWKVYDPADAPGSDLTQVDQKIGFWIEMTAPASVPNPGTLANETTIHLCVGWNLIGFPAGQARPVRTALSSIEGKYTRVFGFDPSDAADPWEIYDVAVPSWANDLELMQPGRGYWVLATAETDLEISNVGAEPEVDITAPADLGVVTAPTDVIGTVRSDRLQGWTLSYQAHGGADAVVFASGSTPVVNGRLATFDPTLLLNGGYTIELTATDFNGQSSVVEVDVSVEGQMKIGNFSVSFRDAEVLVSGLAIQVIRTYDTRDLASRDFGHGWTLGVRQGSYRNNRKPGEGWQLVGGFLPCQAAQEIQPHVTTVRLSDREIYRFRIHFSRLAPTLGGCFAEAAFNFVKGPAPGATLEILGSTEVFWANDSTDVVDPTSQEPYEPRQVRLTLRDGRVFDLDLAQGVTRLADSNGNTLQITPTEISHSAGRSLAIVRDGQGRITRVTDPEGESLLYAYDAAGDLVSVTDREGGVARFTYDGAHRLVRIEDPRGIEPARNEYDDAGRLIRHIDAFGQAVELDHDMAASREVITDRLGRSRVLEYDARGNVVRETDAQGKVTTRVFDSNDHILQETDPSGSTTTFVYDANGNPLEQTDALGNRTSRTYNARGQVLTQTDARGKLTTNEYDARGNLIASTDPLGNTTAWTYDASGHVLTVTSADGEVTRYTYDRYGNVLSETDALDAETSFTYDAQGNRLSQSITRATPAGPETVTWAYVYDASGRVIRSTGPDGTSEQTVYDPVGNVLETIDNLGRKTTFHYDDMGRLVETRFPDGTTTSSTYDAEGQRLSSTDRDGRTTSYQYDAAGRLLTKTFPDGATLTRTYDAAGRLLTTRDARGNITTYEYDRAGRRILIRDALGFETRFGYDGNGNQTSVQDALGHVTLFAYDDAGRLVQVTHPDGTFTRTAWDEAGRKVSETDAAGLTTRFGYDALGRLVTVTDALGQVTSYGYDELGRRVFRTDANGNGTRFEYDTLGRLTKRILPGGDAESFTYDALGNRLTRTDFSGATTSYAYDLSSRLIQRTYPDGSSVSFTYTGSGLRASVTDGRGTTTYLHDDRGRLLELTYPDGRQIVSSYDLEGNRTSLIARSGSQVLAATYTYDALNRLATVTDPQGGLYVYTYDADGNRASVTWPNGVRTVYAWDALDRLTGLTTKDSAGAVLQSYAYTLGPAGNRLRIDEHDGTSREYGYDALYRLVDEHVSKAGATVYRNAFTYDPVGNRLRQVRTDGAGATATLESTYDTRDRMLTTDGIAYSWDRNGNLLGASGPDGAAYSWDFENRLLQVSMAGGTVVRHVYDADGNRVRSETAGSDGSVSSADYLVDPEFRTGNSASVPSYSQILAEIRNGGLAAYYARGEDLLAAIGPDGARFVHAEDLGTVRTLTDEGQQVTDRYGFEAFGALREHQGSDPNPFLFAGEAYDPDTGLYQHRARWRSAESGAFLSEDPLPEDVLDSRFTRYAYAEQRPTDLTDPSGLFSSHVVAALVVLTLVLAIFGLSHWDSYISPSMSDSEFKGPKILMKTQPVLVRGTGWDDVEAMAVLAQAANFWTRDAGVIIQQKRMMYVNSPDFVNLVNSIPPVPAAWGDHSTIFVRSMTLAGLGSTIKGYGTIWNNRGVTLLSDADDQVLAHEWGHTFGLQHEQGTLMAVGALNQMFIPWYLNEDQIRTARKTISNHPKWRH